MQGLSCCNLKSSLSESINTGSVLIFPSPNQPPSIFENRISGSPDSTFIDSGIFPQIIELTRIGLDSYKNMPEPTCAVLLVIVT